MKNKELKKCVKIKAQESEEVVQQVVINGQLQERKEKVRKTVIYCPECGRVIIDAGNASEADALLFCSERSDELENTFKYCSGCGQRLDFPKLIEINKEDCEDASESTDASADKINQEEKENAK